MPFGNLFSSLVGATLKVVCEVEFCLIYLCIVQHNCRVVHCEGYTCLQPCLLEHLSALLWGNPMGYASLYSKKPWDLRKIVQQKQCLCIPD